MYVKKLIYFKYIDKYFILITKIVILMFHRLFNWKYIYENKLNYTNNYKD